MICKLKDLWWLVLLVLSGVPQTSSAKGLFDISRAEFRQLPAAKGAINLQKLDTNLLSAAVFHETNRRRKEHRVGHLEYDAQARRAAAIQSEIMKRRGSISHQNPEHPNLATLEKRMEFVNLKPRFAAENVATAFALKYSSGNGFYVREEHGKKVFSYKPNGETIPPHTYLSFAEALVDAWMASPGHRKNLLHPAAQRLGVECVPAEGKSGMPIFYCTQVFFAALDG